MLNLIDVTKIKQFTQKNFHWEHSDERVLTDVELKNRVSLYYVIVLAITVAFLSRVFFVLAPRTEVWTWPLAWLSLFQDQRPFVIAIYSGLLLSLAATIFYPKIRGLRITVSLFLFFMIPAFYGGAGRAYHEFHALLFTSLCMIPLCFTEQSDAKERNLVFMRAAQACVLFSYFLSGVWKLRNFLNSLLSGMPLSELFQTLPHNIAWNIASGGKQTFLAEQIILMPPDVQFLLWCAVVYLEISCGLVIFRPRLMPLWGGLLLLFHGACALVMDIPYAPTAIITVTVLWVFSKPIMPLKEQAALLPLVGRLLKNRT